MLLLLTNGIYINDPFKKRTKIAFPKVIFGLNSKCDKDYLLFAVDSPQKFDTIKLDSKQETIINKLSAVFRKEVKKGSIEILLGDSIRLYSQAMDEPKHHNCFLGLWQMLERMCCSDLSGGNTKEIINRLKFYRPNFNLIGSGYFYYMEELADKRNNIVHRGVHQINEEDINILKVICEIVLKWIIDNRKEIKTEHHLDEYYRMKNVDDHKLIAKADMISFIRQDRG